MKEFIEKLTCTEWIWEDKELVVQGKVRWKEKQFFEAIRCAREVYEKQGIKADERVLLMIPVGVNLYVTLFSLWSIGAVVVLFDSDMESETMVECMKRADVKTIICTDRTRRVLPKTTGLTIVSCESSMQTGNEGARIKNVFLSPEKEALISFTSGSTGVPKGIVRTFRFLEKQRAELKKHFDYECGDIDFAFMPIFTVTNFIFGIKTVISETSLRESRNIPLILEQMRAENVNRVILSPFLAEAMIEYAKTQKITMPKVKKLFLGGGPIYRKIIEDVKVVFPNASFQLLYGCSEAEPIALFPVHKITKKQFLEMEQGNGLVAGTLCLPCAIIQNNPDRKYGVIKAEEWEKLKLSDEVGEIVVTGSSVMKGYMDGIGDEENKIKVDDVVWHRTGDLGRIKEDGLLYLYGRVKETVGTQEGVIYPFSVESQVYAHYDVKKAAFFLYHGERTLVVSASMDVCNRINKEKENYEYDVVIYMEQIPMDKKHQSKIDYGKLRKVLDSFC